MLKVLLLLVLLLALAGAGGLYAPQLLEGTDDGCQAAQIRIVAIAGQGASPDGGAALIQLSTAQGGGALAEDLAQGVYAGIPPIAGCALLYFLTPTEAINTLRRRAGALRDALRAAAEEEAARLRGELIELHTLLVRGVRELGRERRSYGASDTSLVPPLIRAAIAPRSIRTADGGLQDPYGKAVHVNAQGRQFDIVHEALPADACQALIAALAGPGTRPDTAGIVALTTTEIHVYVTANAQLPLSTEAIAAACGDNTSPLLVRYR